MGSVVNQGEKMTVMKVCHSGKQEIGEMAIFAHSPVNQEALLDCPLTLPSGPQWEEGHDLHGPRQK